VTATNDAALPPCPNCGRCNCTVTRGLMVTGLAPVAGFQTKVSAVQGFAWKCPDCGGFGRAYPPPGPTSADTAPAVR